MLNKSFNFRQYVIKALLFSLCLVFLAACENAANTDPENQSGGTWVNFKNLEQFPVIIYSDPARQAVFAEIAANSTKKVSAEPAPMGMAFYPAFSLNYRVEHSGIRNVITIPYNGPPIIAAVEADKTNQITVPKLVSIEIDSAYIVLINQSNHSLLLKDGQFEKHPMNGGSTIINSGQNAAYDVSPGPVSNYSILSNTTTSVAFPANLTEFRRGIIHVITYNGTSLTPAEERSVLQTVPPSVPENVNAETVSNNSVRITWDAVYGATSYKVYRATSAEGTYSSVGTSASVSHTDTALPAGQPYYYKISALSNTSMESAQSAAVSVIMPPGNVRVTAATANSVSLAWNAFTGASGYNVYRSDSENGTYSRVNTGTVTGTEFTDTNVSAYTIYFYKVSVIIDDIESTQSATVCAVIPIDNVRVTAATANGVSLAWNALSGASGYNVYRSNSENGTYSRINTGAVTGTVFTDTNVSAFTTYFYKVSSLINGIEGTQSTPVSASTGVTVPGSGLAAKLNWLQTNAVSNVDYIVEVTANEGIGPTVLSYSNRNNIRITLRGTGAVRTVSLSSNGTMFTVNNGVRLVLDNNITLQGRSGNTDSLVRVNSGGTLVMNTGSRVTGNTTSYYDSGGGGVRVESNGTFTMSGGTISGNTNAGDYGGGVYVSGTFTMNGGTISSNTAGDYGGGVSVYQGTFTMSGGTISGNTARSRSSNGGGVDVYEGTFTMSGGTISGNTAAAAGGGVYVVRGIFTKTGGTIYGYSANDTANSNAVRDRNGTRSNSGHAVYANFSSSVSKRKETTAGTSVNLSFNGTGSSVAWSGGWDF